MTRDIVCLNCEAALAGPWCHECGQRVEEHPRSLRHLVFEWFEILSHADSRVWRTLRRLAFSPARLSLDYIGGKRASEIPPLRLFFVALLLLFAQSSFGPAIGHPAGPHVEINHAGLDGWIDRRQWPGWLGDWLKPHLARAADDPRAVLAVMGEWSERLAFLMLPIATGFLWVLFAGVRGSKPYDHAIVAVHSLSFSVFVLALFAPIDGLVGDGATLLLLVLPFHLYGHLRGVYGTGALGTLARMTLLGAGSAVGGLMLLGALAGVGLEFAGA